MDKFSQSSVSTPESIAGPMNKKNTYIVVDAVGNGDCFLNAYTLNMAYSLKSNQERGKWIARFNEPLYKPRYIKLVNECIEKLSFSGPPPLDQLDQNATPQEICERFSRFFAQFDLNSPAEKGAMQKIVSPILRRQMYQTTQNTKLKVLNIDGQAVNFVKLMNDAFRRALEETVMAYVAKTVYAESDGRSNQIAAGIFQEHPNFTLKLKDLFHNIDLKELVKQSDKQAKIEKITDDMMLSRTLQPQITEFKKWFFARGKNSGKHKFFHQRSHGFNHDSNDLNSFSYDMMSTLYGTTIEYQQDSDAKEVEGQAVHTDAIPWRIDSHRFSEQKPIKRGERYEDNLYASTPSDLVFKFEFVPGHYRACIPNEFYKLHHESAPPGAPLVESPPTSPPAGTPPGESPPSSEHWPILSGVALALVSLSLWPWMASVTMMLLVSTVSFLTGVLLSEQYLQIKPNNSSTSGNDIQAYEKESWGSPQLPTTTLGYSPSYSSQVDAENIATSGKTHPDPQPSERAKNNCKI